MRPSLVIPAFDAFLAGRGLRLEVVVIGGAALQHLFVGAALKLQSLGRSDLLKTKLFAFCDRRTDLSDCIALAPTQAELAEALPWVERQDANEQWPEHVREMFGVLGRTLGHGF